jgi:hypothetical protein
MNSTVRDIDHQSAAPDPLVVFRCRAEARADLVAAGLYELQEAVDLLQADAEAQGLVARYGQDTLQEVLSQSFARWSL